MMAVVAEDQDDKDKPTPAETPSDGVITTTVAQLEGIVEKIVDNLLGEGDPPDDKMEPPPSGDDHPKTDREKEQSLRDQVKSAVAELERERRHDKEHEELKTPKPPQAEVKPWRHQLWGDRDGN